MSSRTYSADDLIRMRRGHHEGDPRRNVRHRLYNRVTKDLDLGDIVRVHSAPQTNEQYAEPQKAISKHSWTGSENTNPAPTQFDGTEGEWRYKGRTDSEHTEKQPISAPTGLVAQRDEGFQRFYKAVVSPSHVRVTAGGRIVPNTRGSLSPGSRAPRDRLGGESATANRSASGPEPPPPYGYPLPPAGLGMVPGMFPGWLPPALPGLPPVAPPYPMLPWPMVPPGFPLASPIGLSPHALSAMSEPNESNNDNKLHESGSSKAATVHGTTPERTPQSRQSLHHQSVMLAHSQPYYHFSSPGYPWPSYMPPVTSQYVEAETNQRGLKSKSSRLSLASDPETTSQTGGPTVAQTPPISSIRPSEITKKQIDVLRQNLKYLEDQLQYNKHQIDEKDTERKAELIKQQIKQFEKNLDNQLNFEGSHYPKTLASKIGSNRSNSSRGHLGSKASLMSEEGSDRGSYKLDNTSSTSLAQSVRSRSAKDKRSAFSSGINSTKSVSAFAPMRHTIRGSAQLDASRTLVGLPATAALAPPFKPNGEEDKPALASATIHEQTLPVMSQPQAWNNDAKERSEDSRLLGRDIEVQEIASQRRPYLVGHLPAGVNPNQVQDTDYAYPRALTEDELRARHMYWGKTPRHLQKGMPKFDGKDFYPPSPTKERSSYSNTSSSVSIRHIPVGNPTIDYGLRKDISEGELFRSLEHVTPRAVRGPLGIPTQSEALAESTHATDEDPGLMNNVKRCGSLATNADAGDLSAGFEQVEAPTSMQKSSSDEGEDDKNLLFKGRNPSRHTLTKAHNEIWRSMLKRGKSSGHLAPGTVSSTTVQGVLPQYAGHATASLTPAIVNSACHARATLGKTGDIAEHALNTSRNERKRENLPPVGSTADEASAAAGRNSHSLVTR